MVVSKKQKSSKTKKARPAGKTGGNSKMSIKPTGLTDLDSILHGGFPYGASILLAGPSGSGKTILASQWLFAGYKSMGESGIYVSMTENETSFVRNLKKMSYYDRNSYGQEKVHFLDLRQQLERINLGDDKDITNQDTRKICELILDEVIKINAKRLVLDSVTAIGYRLKDAYLIRNFIFQLGAYLGFSDVNTILTSEASGPNPSVFGVEEFICDGVIKMDRDVSKIGEPIRTFQILKMRGTDYETYPVNFDIVKDGITFFPSVSRDLKYQASKQRMKTEVTGFDEMLNGGLFKGASVLLSGTSGTGKTIISLQCVVGALSRGEKAVYVSFEESDGHLARTAEAFGWRINDYVNSGQLRLICRDANEQQIGKQIHEIIKAIDDIKPDLLVIDSLSALKQSHTEESMHDFASQIIMATKSRAITVLFTAASSSLLGAGETVSGVFLSSVIDVIILLRYVEIQSEMRHGLLVLKMRGSTHDRKLREFVFGEDGIRVLYDFRGYENIMSGGVRKSSKSMEDELLDLFVEILGPFGEQMFVDVKKRGLDVKTVKLLLAELGDQGIISLRRKDEFANRVDRILQGSPLEKSAST